MNSSNLQRPIGFSPAEISALVNAEVVAIHAEEAAFLWTQRDQAVRAPHYSLQDLADLDERVEANLDGLRIAGEAGWEIAKEGLGQEEAGEVFTAAVLAFESGDPQRIEEVLAVGAQSLELARGVISALGWLTFEQAEPHILSLGESDEPIRRRIAIAAAAIHRQAVGQVMDDPVVRPRGLRAVGELGKVALLPHCQASFDAEDEQCRFWGAWSAALLGDVKVVRVLREIAEGGGLLAERAGDLAARRMALPDALQWQQQLAANPDHHRLAAKVAGTIGDPALIPWLMELMEIPDLARVAGEAFSMITGVDIAYEDLEGKWPEGFEAGPTEGPEDEEVVMDPDEDLPWPEPELIANWWADNGGKFAVGTRHLLGKPISLDNLRRVLREGRQRQRAAAALELVLGEPAQPLFEVRAPGRRQLKRLEAWTS